MSSIDDESKNKPETSPESSKPENLATTSQNATESPEAPQNANMDDEIDISEEPEPKNGENKPKSQYSDLEKEECIMRSSMVQEFGANNLTFSLSYWNIVSCFALHCFANQKKEIFSEMINFWVIV